MKRVHLHDSETGRTRTITTTGGGIRVVPNKTEREVAAPLAVAEVQARRAAVRELSRETPEMLAKREVMKRLPLQKLISLAIEQGLFDRLKIDNG